MAFNNRDSVIGKSLMIEGEWAAQEIEVFKQFLRPGMLALDIGAHIGTHTIPMARMVSPGGVVVSFEPQRIPHQILCANATLNALDNIYAYRAFVGARSGVGHSAEYNPRAESNYGAISAGKYWNEGMLLSDVPMLTVDELDLPACHFMKLDIEGEEPNALLGALGTIKRFKPAIYLEANVNDNLQSLADILEPLDYTLSWHVYGCSRSNNYRGATPLFDTHAETNIIATPPAFQVNAFRQYQRGDTRESVVKAILDKQRESK